MKTKLLLLLCTALITRCCTPCYAYGPEDLDWSVRFHYTISPDNTLVSFNYLVSNLSELGDANGMVSFTVEGGSNQGVFYAAGDTGSFAAQIFSDYTTFTGSVVNPNGNNTFSLLATYLGDPIGGTASAISSGIETPIAFENKYVEFTAVHDTTPPNIRMHISDISSITSGLTAVTIGAEVINFANYHRSKDFRIATATNLIMGVWTTNSTPPQHHRCCDDRVRNKQQHPRIF